ncbi:MAG: fasciclin domain-containing protein [Balneolaceae bacterium]|nr:fasciclin domain-containing protein [Balneolaceae bacterium]MCH8549895.1 fasciclin domain-containing protein [Balneolaceae bacterium]
MLSMKKLSTIFSAVIALVLVAGINISVAQSGDVVDIINDSDDHAIFSELLEMTEMDQVISEQGPFTVIAPTDDAFEALGGELDDVMTDPERAQNVVVGHLFQGEVPATDVEPALDIAVEDGDIAADNGLIHSVGEVIIN